MILNLLYIVLSVITIAACIHAIYTDRKMRQYCERLDREYDDFYKDLHR